MELDIFITELRPYFATLIDLRKWLENCFYYLGETRKFMGQNFHPGPGEEWASQSGFTETVKRQQ